MENDASNHFDAGGDKDTNQEIGSCHVYDQHDLDGHSNNWGGCPPISHPTLSDCVKVPDLPGLIDFTITNTIYDITNMA
jgi:hypothetical protein